MSKGYYRDEALPEITPTLDWSTITNWDEISEALDDHVSTAHEFMAPVPSVEAIFAVEHRHEVEALQEQVADLEAQIDAYRSSVARRRRVPIQNVTLDHGEVVYRPVGI